MDVGQKGFVEMGDDTVVRRSNSVIAGRAARLVLASVGALVLGFAPYSSASADAPLKAGSEARVTRSTNVRSCPSTSCRVVGTLAAHQTVRLSEGPRSASGYRWWKHSAGGWSIEQNLTPVMKPPASSGPEKKPKTAPPATAATGSLTPAAFLERYRGTFVADLAGKFQGECVSLAKQWAHQAYGVRLGSFGGGPDGNGKQEQAGRAGAWSTGSGFDLAHWERVPAGHAEYRPGDLVFFPASAGNGWYGHIAIVASTSGATGTFTVVEQNYGKGGVVRGSDRTVRVSESLGVMRFRAR